MKNILEYKKYEVFFVWEKCFMTYDFFFCDLWYWKNIFLQGSILSIVNLKYWTYPSVGYVELLVSWQQQNSLKMISVYAGTVHIGTHTH